MRLDFVFHNVQFIVAVVVDLLHSVASVKAPGRAKHTIRCASENEYGSLCVSD